MGELEEKLNAILGDQKAMGQIMALAQSLSGREGEAPQGQGERPEEERPQAEGTSPLQELDPRLVELGVRLMQEYNSRDDRGAALLEALRPFLREERLSRVDRAVEIARLSRVVRVLIQVMGENGGSLHV